MPNTPLQHPGIQQGDIGDRYTRKRLQDEVYVAHFIKAGDRIRVQCYLAAGVAAAVTTVTLFVGGRVRGMDGQLTQFGDTFAFTVDGAQTVSYVMAPEGYVVDLIATTDTLGLAITDVGVKVDIVQGIGSNAAAVGLLASGYVSYAHALGLGGAGNIGGGGGGGMAIGGAVTSGTTGSVLFVGVGPVLAQDNTNLKFDSTGKKLTIAGSLVPGGKTPITISAGDDTFGGSSLLFDNATDGYVSLRSPQNFVMQSPGGVGLVTEDVTVGSAQDISLSAGSGSGAGVNGGGVGIEGGSATGHSGASISVGGATDAVDGSVAIACGGATVQLLVSPAASIFTGAAQMTAVAVAALPASPVGGMIDYVNNALAPALGATVVGGGAANALVWYNGANWTVIGI